MTAFFFSTSLTNDALKKEVQAILTKLESFGMILCPTEGLYQTVKKAARIKADDKSSGKDNAAAGSAGAALKLVTAKEIQAAVDANESVIRMAPGGIVTPLARDQAKEYAVKIETAG